MPDSNPNQATNAAPLTVTLQDAIARARKNNPEYHAALTAYGSAKEDRVQGRAALLPGVNYDAGFLYTQGNGTPTGRFGHQRRTRISQPGQCSPGYFSAGDRGISATRAAEALAKARAEIAARGLVVTVVQAYYGFVVAQRKYDTASAPPTRPGTFSISARSLNMAAR